MFAIERVFGTAFTSIIMAGAAMAQEAPPETRLGEEGFSSPPATLAQMDWLKGQWFGDGIGGAPAMESWLPPVGGTMVGTFVQQAVDGSIMFTEHMYLIEDEDTLALRLKHFNADLTGWEEKDDMLTFRLVAIEPCAAYFNALTLRCSDPQAPGEGLVAAVRMKGGSELLFRFNRSRPEVPGAKVCRDASTTLEINQCYADVLSKADARRTQYLRKAVARHAERPDLVAKIRAGDAAFTAYRSEECGAVLEDWIEGTIRGVMMLSCKIAMTDQRTHRIWRNWLTHMDSTPPLLPEPQPST